LSDVFPTFVHGDVAFSSTWQEVLLEHSPDVVFDDLQLVGMTEIERPLFIARRG